MKNIRFPRWLRKLLRRRFLIALLIIAQATLFIYMVLSGSVLSHRLAQILTVTSILVVLYIVSKRDKGAYKTLWVFLILSFPILGGLLYLLITGQSATKRMKQDIQRVQTITRKLYLLPGDGYSGAREITGSHFPQVRYLQDYVGYPIYSQTRTTYLEIGEKFHERLLQELEKAEHYIFLEFFIIQDGVFWGSVLDILKRKAAQGVKVRILYDDLGCFFLLPTDFAKQMNGLGIECAIFNPFRPFLTVKQNNRDHRKIVVIDGKVAFTGGINIADEYINAKEKYGHWKDSAILLEGKAAWSFALMFLEMWELCQKCNEDIASYYPWQFTPCDVEPDGLVIPYADSPMDQENVGEHVYLQILNEAQNYVYINTPYLIVDDSMISALCLAAKRGVDVRIVTPHRWDKWAVHMTTRSYYRELIRAGVKVYEYTNGFIHAKSFVSDDVIATVGTTNLDFRSLYLHFECGAWMYGSLAVLQVKQDFLKTLPVCTKIEEKDCSRYLVSKLLQEVLRLFAPLM